ncbi:TPA: glucose-6-phosphate isomerase [Campylobacter fetus subsp. venerealis]|uniref:glucose-6-phosphate isomerase n=1 Tax=Campylobacter fetus TaxID=196 RepID=UPI0003D7E42F|nr:glucose-6-phosphate isomerase [Campylobacter fetus]OCS22504.1 glucose-6-phosphate isomerase [Campylobacter fetus subsp. venerealis cfvi97/532]OCS26502.1 glucose-6-phosphate isomerase [Campylobacter fetus subsp. venerealis cfvB10]OCS29899.1 glucose-6-phosphate isomerase [Campylobacter fetus subsp. venerealis LMG 6570 = CCUG 33900]OCS43214.1 glucose-6-phosphate isomerase [Campylobacter fetus subsp. venerealis cfvi02/298]AHE93433.1 phosphoglucose isomerase [Campylobacter fetus subsp. venereali
MVINELKFPFKDMQNISSYARRMNEELNNDEIGYYHLPSFGEEISEKLALYRKNVNFNTVVLIGVGGSSLGVKALYEMLNLKTKLIFLDNLDPFYIENRLKDIEFDSSIFILSSKSGTTIEPISIYKYILDLYSPKNYKNFIIITDPQSPLEEYANLHNITVFNIPKNVGGRFSVLSAIGLVPLGLCGVDTSSLLDGAVSCKKQFLEDDDSLILQKAYHYATHKSAKINVVFSYSERFHSFNDWYVQLWAESLGKKRGYKRMGLTPVGLIGSKDQHSFLQLIMEGIKDKTVTFLILKDHLSSICIPNLKLEYLDECDFVNEVSMSTLLNAQAKSTIQALLSENISIDTILVDRLDEWHSGWLIYYYELLTSATGLMLGVNTYDQPGVEASKRILKNLLSNN